MGSGFIPTQIINTENSQSELPLVEDKPTVFTFKFRPAILRYPKTQVMNKLPISSFVAPNFLTSAFVIEKTSLEFLGPKFGPEIVRRRLKFEDFN
jgi:hypothetical protein